MSSPSKLAFKSETDMKISHSLFHALFLLICLFIFNHSAYTTSTNCRDLVDEVCKQTSNYSFCVQSLYSDPHTPGADRSMLADVAFRLAYRNASSTLDEIQALLKNATSVDQRKRLQNCSIDYKEAIFKFGQGLDDDLNSETYDYLAEYAGVAADSVDDCEATFKGTVSPLTCLNNYLKGLSEICVSVSKLFKTAS